MKDLLSVAKTILAVIGTVFVCMLIYGKLTGHRHTGWNKDTGPDCIQTFTKAYVTMPDGNTKTYTVSTWRDYPYSDQLQFTTSDGLTILTHASRLVLTNEK